MRTRHPSEVVCQMLNSTTKSKLPRHLKALISLAFWIAVWFGLAALVGQELLIPTPFSVLKTLVLLAGKASFWQAAGLSLLRIFGGFAFGVLLGTIFAVLTIRFELIDALISPLIKIVRATPVASFIILALLWIGHSFVPAFISMLMVIPVVWESLRAAILGTDRDLLEMAKSYRFGTFRTIKLVYVPSVLSSFTAACLTSIGLAWKSGIAAEVLCLPRLAIGTDLYYSKIYLETPSLFAWTAVVIMLSFALEKLFSHLLVKRGAVR